MSDIHQNVKDEPHHIEQLVDEIEYRQHNTTYPDLLVNASSADELMWKGSARITKVQRIGLGLFGLAFMIGGISLVNAIYGQKDWWLSIPIGLAFFGVGCKLLWNSVRKNALPKSAGEDE
jgi:hypothetical protein